ncbi:helix-turn-helix transcriptional regulator [Falsiroseomonas sp. E2-1-a20]|uniref:helix-turn-helix transcriptional regulator n=1 Tax=Falsiroseomonas sp. E2-1-a20 TaxID=3239300 RepID=UPI003F2F5362
MLRNAAFVDGIATVTTFDDFDAMAVAVPGWEIKHSRLGSGAFSARIEIAMTAELQISRFVTNSALLTTGWTPEGASGASLIVSAVGMVRSRGRTIDTATMAPARLQCGEVHSLTAGAAEKVIVLASHELFQRHVGCRFDQEAAMLGSDWLLRMPDGAANCAERGRAIAALLPVFTMPAAASPEARHRLQECVLQILLEGIETDPASRRAAPLSVRRRIARAAEEILRARIDDPPSLRELCESLQVSERTLHLAFQEGFGMVPKAYLRALRLSAAHRRLRCGKGLVTEVATELGLFHFGRFSTEYRAMFGEPPSETLRRARGF